MSRVEQIEIRRLDAAEVRAHLDGLAAVLADCVEGGASVGYLAPFTHDEARRVYETYAADVERGGRLLFAWPPDGEAAGSRRSGTFVDVNELADSSKVTDDLASRIEAEEEDAVVEIVVELRRVDENETAPTADRGAAVAARKEGFRAAAEPVVNAIVSSGGEVTGEAWINQTLRARVPARVVLRIAEEDAVALVDVPHSIEAESA